MVNNGFKILLSLERKMLVSSTKRWNLRILEHEGRSFIYSRNRRGPSTLPWGTPCVIIWGSDKVPFMQTFCVLFDKYDLSQFNGFPLIP